MSNRLGRRHFIQLMGGAVGGALLTTSFGCVGGDGDDGPPIPNGYRFYRVKSRGTAVGDSSKLMSLTNFNGSIHISDSGVVTFDARDEQNVTGLFQLGIDYGGAAPSIGWERTVAYTGQTLPDGREVAEFTAMDVNGAGNIAAIIRAGQGDLKHHYGTALYLDESQNGFEPVMQFGYPFPEGDVTSSGVFGDVDISDGEDILVVANYRSESVEILPGEGVLHLPGASLDSSKLVLGTGSIMPSTEYALTTFGLVDQNGDGHYAIQGRTTPLSSGAEAEGSFGSGGVLLTGNLSAPAEQSALITSPAIGTGVHNGLTDYGPRVTPKGAVYGIFQSEDEEQMTLVHDEEVVLTTGGDSPIGGQIDGFDTGSVNRDGVLFYTLYSLNDYSNVNLMAYNGSTHSSILARGDVLSDGGAPVRNIIFGTTTKHIDAEDRLVLFCTFEDDTMSLVVGIPS